MLNEKTNKLIILGGEKANEQVLTEKRIILPKKLQQNKSIYAFPFQSVSIHEPSIITID
jgi:hypothetical protein